MDGTAPETVPKILIVSSFNQPDDGSQDSNL
jgi:hypothetical protein